MSVQVSKRSFVAVRLVAAVSMVVSTLAFARPGMAVVSAEVELPDAALRSAQADSVVRGARLVPGTSGLALELSLLSSPVSIPRDASLVAEVEGTLLRFDRLPEVENLRCSVPGAGGSFTVGIISGQVIYGVSGVVDDLQVSAQVGVERSVSLAVAVERALGALVERDVQLANLGDQAVALVTVRDQQVIMTLYRDQASLYPLAEVRVPEQGYPSVNIQDQRLRRVTADDAGGKGALGSLQIVGVLEAHQGSLSAVVGDYLQDVAASVDYQGLRRSALRLGRIGEGGLLYGREVISPWQGFHSQRLGGMDLSGGEYRAEIYKAPHQLPRIFVNVSSPDEAALAIQEYLGELATSVASGLGRLNARQRQQVKLVIDDDVYWKMRRGDYTTAEIEMLRTVSESMEQDRRIGISLENALKTRVLPRSQGTMGFGAWLGNMLWEGVLSFVGNAAVGGGVSLGSKIYVRYQEDGRLPHRYSNRELEMLATEAGQDAIKAGLAGVAAYGLMSVGRLPTVVAGTAVGVGGRLLDHYQQGRLSGDNLPGLLVPVAADSAAASVGAYLGGGISASLPLLSSVPGVQLSGVLAGSLAGHYLYRYVYNNRDRLLAQLPVPGIDGYDTGRSQ